MSSTAAKTIAVLGAGATGLAAAHRLTRLGHRVRLFEKSGRAGGAIRTELAEGGWLVEAGPNSLLSGEPALASLIEELGLTSERLGANPTAQKRFIVRRGRMVAAPLSPPAFLTSPLFSPWAKIQLLSEVFARPRVRTTDLSLADFVAAHFGREVVAYGLDPLVSGVYAGKADKLSARYSFPKLWEIERIKGSIIRGQIAAAKARKAAGEPRAEIFTFQRGLQTLTDALAARLPAGTLVLDATLDTILPGKQWSVIWHDTAGTPYTESFDAIVVALPAPALAQLRIGPHGERPLASLAAMEHPPVSSLFLGFRRDQVAHPLDGFGALVPSAEQRSVLGILFSSTLFPGRAPAGHVALTVMVGGARQPELAGLSTDKLLAAVRRDLTELVGATGDPVFLRHHHWPRAIPQYNLGHEQFLKTIADAEKTHAGLFIGGQCRDGIAVPACLAAGENLAARATK